MRNKKLVLLTLILTWILISLACTTITGRFSGDNQNNDPQAEGIPDAPEAPQPEPAMVEIRQWASFAEASSQYSDTDWSSQQAIGAPNSLECKDLETAWASEKPNTVESITVYFDTAVYATQITVHENYVPGQEIKVEIIDEDNNLHPVLEKQPHEEETCPYLLTIDLEPTDFKVIAVRVTVDQSLTGAWTEIDAVELVGLIPQTTQSPADTGPQPSVQLGDLQIPDGISWLVDEDSSGMEFGTFGNIAVSENGHIFVTDNGNGILVFDLNGKHIETYEIEDADFSNPADIEIGPDGNLYLADWGADGIYVFTQSGDLLYRFGENGNGPGQFGDFGPRTLAVGPNNTIFVTDDNRDDNDDTFQRLMWFTWNGDFLGEYRFPESGVYPVGMEFGPDGNLYIVNYLGGAIQKWDESGNYLGDFAVEAVAGTSPQHIEFDGAGNIYLTVWEEPGVLFLDPAGNYLGHFGYDEHYETSPWPDGAMNMPLGITVLPDGSQLFFTDYANQQPLLEALDIR